MASSDLVPDHLFFAYQENSTLAMMSGSGAASVPNAHQSTITAVEVTVYNGTDVIFSAGLDHKLKAWRIDKSNANSPQIVPLEERDLQTPIYCL